VLMEHLVIVATLVAQALKEIVVQRETEDLEDSMDKTGFKVRSEPLEREARRETLEIKDL